MFSTIPSIGTVAQDVAMLLSIAIFRVHRKRRTGEWLRLPGFDNLFACGGQLDSRLRPCRSAYTKGEA